MEIKTFNLREDNPNVKLDVFLCGEFPIPTDEKRPTVLVIPGGGYRECAPHEAEPVARAFMAHGCNAAVLYYSVMENAAGKNPLEDASRAVTILRRNAEKWHGDPNKIAVIGFSAGGHLAGWISTMWNDEDIMRRSGVKYPRENRPDAMMLCYPVILGGEFSHKGSFQRILGTENPTDEQLEMYSLEKRINADTPPAFLWHIACDAGVPVQNSLYMASALAKNNIPVELHVFPHGRHGMSLANSEVMPKADTYVKRWIDMAVAWLNMTFGSEF